MAAGAEMKHSLWDYVPSVAAAAAILAFAGLFVRETSMFRRAVADWAERDLRTRAIAAAEAMREPLEAGDFTSVSRYGASCAEDGLRLTVFTAPGGVYFDSLPVGSKAPTALEVKVPCGEYTLRLALSLSRVMAPFDRAKPAFWLAAMLGGAGVLLVFYFTYRQRLRISEMKKVEAFRRDFIADVSHELKTPLTGILGAVDLVGDPGLPEENRRRLLGLIKKESVRLNGLAQGILSLERIERAGEIGLMDFVPADIAEEAKETVSRYAERAAAAGVSIVLDAPASCLWPCDIQLISQAMSNLIENALRHAQATRIALAVRNIDNGVCITVEDDGIGIPPGHEARIFERFHRVDASRSADTGGAGLGLAIVRAIARLHRGDVVLEEVKPHGCCFVLHIH